MNRVKQTFGGAEHVRKKEEDIDDWKWSKSGHRVLRQNRRTPANLPSREFKSKCRTKAIVGDPKTDRKLWIVASDPSPDKRETTEYV